MRYPACLNELLCDFILLATSSFCGNVAGIYLHGSAAMDCYNPEKSDVDLIVVTRKAPTDAEKRAFMDGLIKLDARLPIGCGDVRHGGFELSVVTQNACAPFVYPTPFELHYSRGHRASFIADPDGYMRKMRGTDKDLAAHFTVIRHRGVCLYGLPINAVFAPVPGADYLDSIFEDVASVRTEICENTVYCTLNLTRVLAFIEDGRVLSKREGGIWALDRLPDEFRPLIECALKDYETEEMVEYDERAAAAYAEYMLERIEREKQGTKGII